LSPAYSAPRAPNEDKEKNDKVEKSAAPNKLPTPTPGETQQATPTPPPPAEPQAAPEANRADATKEEDKTKPDAEALDKAGRKAAKTKPSKTKTAKVHRKPAPNALAALAGAPNLDTSFSFARPTPKTKIFGGTEDVRWMSEVEAMLEAKVTQLPRSEHYQSGGKVAICFHVDVDGRVIQREYCAKSGYPDIDRLAMKALLEAAPFPRPPPGLDRGLVWFTTFDGQLPKLRFR
jgi:TonB family protein